MMRSFIIVIILVLVACSPGRKERIYLKYLKSYNETIKIINAQNEIIYKEFNFGMTDFFYGNPLKIKPWYEKAMSIKQKANKIIKKINSLENNLSNNLTNNSSLKNIEFSDKTAQQEVKLDKSELAILKKEFLQFQDLLKSTMGKDTSRYDGLTESIKSNLNTNNWNHIPCLTGRKSKLIEVLAILAKLKTNIKFAESDLIRYLFSEIDVSCFRFYKIAAIVEPNALIIPQGSSYSANIFIGTTDSTVNSTIFVNGKQVNVRSGVGTYKEKVSSKETIVRRKGYFLLTNPATGKPIKIPFQLEYQVLK